MPNRYNSSSFYVSLLIKTRSTDNCAVGLIKCPKYHHEVLECLCRSGEAVYHTAARGGANCLGVVLADSILGARAGDTHTFPEDLLLQILH